MVITILHISLPTEIFASRKSITEIFLRRLSGFKQKEHSDVELTKKEHSDFFQ